MGGGGQRPAAVERAGTAVHRVLLARPAGAGNPSLVLDYIVAPPRMAYSINEVFMDVTDYMDTYKMTARELSRTIILDILKTTGITAAAGMDINLYLVKIAIDIVTKHVHADKDRVRIAKLSEMIYRWLLWTHRPLADF